MSPLYKHQVYNTHLILQTLYHNFHGAKVTRYDNLSVTCLCSKFMQQYDFVTAHSPMTNLFICQLYNFQNGRWTWVRSPYTDFNVVLRLHGSAFTIIKIEGMRNSRSSLVVFISYEIYTKIKVNGYLLGIIPSRLITTWLSSFSIVA